MILVVSRNFPPDIGGMQILMGNLSESLAKHDTVKVFANKFPNSEMYDKKSFTSIERISGIKIFLKYRKANLVNNFIKKNKNIKAVFFDHWKSIELINKNYLKENKTFCLIHSKEINHTEGTWLNKRVVKSLNKADYVIANSRFTKELAIKIGINKIKIKVINPGINAPKKIENSFKDEANQYWNDSSTLKEAFPKIITVARLEKRKNHDKILMTIKNLIPKFPNIKYISIGDGEEKNNLIKLKNELNLKNNIIFLNNISEEKKLSLLASSNLFLMPSIIDKKSVEGFGISFIEAASYGIASIGGKDGGASDAIVHNNTGLICDGNNLNSIYDSVINFFDEDKFIKLGKAALKYSESFHWEKVVKNYLNLIKS